MSEEKTNVMRVLDQKKTAYTPHWFDPKGSLDGGTAAALLGKDPARRPPRRWGKSPSR